MKLDSTPFVICFTLFLGLAVATPALAATDCTDEYFLSVKVKTKCENLHYMPMGAGIGSPSLTSSHIENPAGLIYNTQFKAHASISQVGADTGTAPTRRSLVVAAGTGDVGAAVGIHHYTAGNQVSVGLASLKEDMNLAGGVSATYSRTRFGAFSPVADSSSFPVNLGTLLNPKGHFRIGASLFDILKSTRLAAIGFGTSLGSNLHFGSDILMSVSGGAGMSKTTIGTGLWIFQITLGVGTRFGGTKNAPQMRSGLSLGLGTWLGEHFRLTLSINQVESFYLGATLAL